MPSNNSDVKWIVNKIMLKRYVKQRTRIIQTDRKREPPDHSHIIQEFSR